MAPSDAVRYQFDSAATLIAGVRPDQLADPTPCSEWNVGDLINHLTAGSRVFGTLLAGGEAELPASPPDLIGDDPVGVFAEARTMFTDGLDSPGALERSVTLPMGDVPAPVLVDLLKFDVLVHCHDLARATGQPFDPPADVVAEARQIASGAADGLRAAGALAPAVEPGPGATPIEELSAFCGRTI